MLPDPPSLLREITASDIPVDYSAWTAPDPRDRRHQIEVPGRSTHVRPVEGALRMHTHLVHRRGDRVVDGWREPHRRFLVLEWDELLVGRVARDRPLHSPVGWKIRHIAAPGT